MQRPAAVSTTTGSSGISSNGAVPTNKASSAVFLASPSSSSIGGGTTTTATPNKNATTNGGINRRRGAAASNATSSKKSKQFNPNNRMSRTTVGCVLVASILVVFITTKFLLTSIQQANTGGGHSGDAKSRHRLSDVLKGVPNLLRRGNTKIHVDYASEKLHQVMSSVSSLSQQHNINALKYYPYPLEPLPSTTTSSTIRSTFVPLGGKRYTEYTTGLSPYRITTDLMSKSDVVARSRRIHVKNAMQFAWEGYVKHAFGMDEILPQSGSGSNGWGGHAITLVDALDTLWLMDMKHEFNQARDYVRDKLDFSKVGHVSVFETTIRDLGGLLSAYDWSNDPVFLEKAIDLGERLLHAFDNSNTGIPFGQVSLSDGAASNIGWTGGNVILSEFGTLQIEFRYLAKVSNRPELATKVEKVFEIMDSISPPNGLFPYYYRNHRNGEESGLPEPANNKLTFGAMSDSFYEYMLKVWIQGGKTEPLYRKMYDKAIEGMHNELLHTSQPSGLTYIGDKNDGKYDAKMDHLVCFMGGLLALGAYTDPLGMDSTRAIRDLKTGKALTYTCYQMYARMNTGISPEFVQFEGLNDFVIGRGAPHYLLRPEAVESMFILNQLTGDPVYREWGWEIFQAIEKYCKTKYAYGALSNVQDTNGRPRDKMESFFLAETLKYLYLLQDPDTEIDILNRHVFNTEAHPLRIFPLLSKAMTEEE